MAPWWPWCQRRRYPLAIVDLRFRKRWAPLADRMRSYRKPRYLFILKVKINSLDVETEKERYNWIEFERVHAIHSREDVNKYIDEFEEDTGEAVLEYSVKKTIRFADSMVRVLEGSDDNDERGRRVLNRR